MSDETCSNKKELYILHAHAIIIMDDTTTGKDFPAHLFSACIHSKKLAAGPIAVRMISVVCSAVAN